ncbi:MerR family transcriptional regulator [Nonomuraea maritima]|uniref:MerR family transcriptional regulator n=1 Tax=Nonomuraea maritima TaxID=683260 RepID=UPI0037228603
MTVAEEDPLWGAERIADYLDVDSDWVIGFARDQGLDLFDIGGGKLRARRSDVIRFALRNSRTPLGQPDFQPQVPTDDKPAASVPHVQEPPANPLQGYRPRISNHGRDFDLFPIGALAAAVGRKPDTVRQWENDGIIPATQNRTTSHDVRGTRRLYTRTQILAIHHIAQEEGILPPFITKNWVTETRFVERVRAVFDEHPHEHSPPIYGGPASLVDSWGGRRGHESTAMSWWHSTELAGEDPRGRNRPPEGGGVRRGAGNWAALTARRAGEGLAEWVRWGGRGHRGSVARPIIAGTAGRPPARARTPSAASGLRGLRVGGRGWGR